MKEPKVLGSGIPLYGYNVNEYKHRIIDPITAPIVKQIFNDYIKGLKRSEIIKKLYENKIVSPGYYLYLKYNYKSDKYENYNDDKKYIWCNDSIQRIIRNIEYTGDLINHKFEKKSFKNKKREVVNNDDRIYFNQLFEPIVSKEIYLKANELMDKQLNSSINTKEKKFLGLCKCGNCNSILKYERRNTNSYYLCKNKNCLNKNHINSNILEEVIKREILKIKNELLNNKEKYKKEINTLHKPYINNNENEKDEIKNQININNLNIERLIESNVNNEIPKEIYNKLLNKFLIKKQQLEKINNKKQVNIEVDSNNVFDRIINLTLNYKLLNTLLKEIVINKKTIIINYKDYN